MPEREGTRFPSSHAFVVQMAADAEAAFEGRIEHLTTGDLVHFDSLAALGEFVSRILDVRIEAGASRDPGSSDDRTQRKGES